MQKTNIFNRYKNYLLQEDWGDFLLSHLNPTLSWQKVKARVIRIDKETEDTKTFFLQPNSHWKGNKPGQHLGLTVSVDGRRQTRFYSITSEPESPIISITVRKQLNGRVSGYLHERLALGDVIELTQARGEFVLESKDSQLLFIAGGSGITPIFSMIKSVKMQNQNLDMVLLYFSRKADNIIFYNQLNELSQSMENLKIYHVLTDQSLEGFESSFLDKALIDRLCPDYLQRKAFVCGPVPLKNSALSLLNHEKTITESFVLNQGFQKRNESKVFTVKLSLSQKTIQVNGEENLLVELEKAGVHPNHGCRMGICHTCLCTKQVGEVKDLSNGKTSDEAKSIQLCIHRAESDLELEL
jgi:stearoyl-CoA 9-desaturase NADPH oxidoreductase